MYLIKQYLIFEVSKKVKTKNLQRQRKEEQRCHQNLRCVRVKNQDLLKSKKQNCC